MSEEIATKQQHSSILGDVEDIYIYIYTVSYLRGFLLLLFSAQYLRVASVVGDRPGAQQGDAGGDDGRWDQPSNAQVRRITRGNLGRERAATLG